MKGFVNQVVAIISVLLFCTCAVHAQTVPTPTQTDAIIIDNGTPGKADPGDKIRYKVTVQNTHPTTPATGVQLNVVPDLKTTLDPLSFRTTPLALPDAYSCIGNVGITVPDGSSDLLANDYDDMPAGLSIMAVANAATTQGGSITIAADGSFSYNPPRGFEGTDTYQYTLIDGNDVDGVGPIPGTDVGTVTITVSGMIWFINNNAGACASSCDGRLSNPYTSLAAFNTANDGVGLNPADNDNIFIYESAAAYTNGIGLRNGQKLFGQDATATLAAMTGLAPPMFSNPLPTTSPGGTLATITNAAGDGIQLGQDNTLRGFVVGACSDFGIDNNGVLSVGNLVASEVAINNTTGGGFDASGGSGALMNAVFSSISSTGGINGINLTNCAGTFTVNGGTITNPGGPGVLIVGGTVVFTCSAVVSDNSGFAVDVSDHDSGNVTLSGNITSTDSGIRVQNCNGGTKTFSGSSKNLNTGAITAVRLINNTGALIDLSGGGLVITTTTGTGFSATGGGTVTVTGTGNTISSGTVTALNVVNTTIGASNLNFQSISANGGTNGIVLNSTGSSGGLIVTGTGSAGTGGTIQNCTTAGISLTTTSGVSLSYMNVQNSGDDGISGTSVTGCTLSNCTITNNGNASADEGIYFVNLSGTSTITNCSVTNNAHNNLWIYNDSGTLAALTVTGSTFEGHNNGGANGNHGLLFDVLGAAVVTSVNITGSTFRNNKVIGMQVLTGDNSTISGFTVSGCTFSDTGTGNSQEISADFSAAGTSSMTYKFLNNTLTGHNSHAFNTFTSAVPGTTGTFNATISGNTIGNAAVAGSGSLIGNGLRININGDKTARVLVDNNTIRQCPNGRGIEVICRNGTGGADVTVTNNNVNTNDVSGFPLCAIFLQSNDITIPNTLRADVRNNTVLAGTAFDVLTTFIGLAETGTSTLQLVDTAPASANATAQLTSTNTGSASANAGVALIAGPINLPPP